MGKAKTDKRLRRRTLGLYRTAFGVRPPFTVLLDGSFIEEAFLRSVDIKDALSHMLDGPVKLDRDQPPWVVATYDRILRRSIMQRSRYAVVRMVLGVPVLVQPDEECQRRMMMLGQKHAKLAEFEKKRINAIAEEANIPKVGERKKRITRREVLGPNPLSVKRKAKKRIVEQPRAERKKPTRRKRKRKPKGRRLLNPKKGEAEAVDGTQNAGDAAASSDSEVESDGEREVALTSDESSGTE